MSLLDMARQKRSARLAAGATPAGSSDSKGGERLFSKSGKHKAPTTAEEIFTQAVSPVAPVVPYQQQRPPKPQQPQYPYPNHPSYPSSNNPNQISLPHPCQSDNPALMANHLQHTVSDIINQLKQSDGKYDIGFTYDFFVRPQKVSESEQRRLDEEKRKKDKILMKIQRQEKLEHERLEQEIRKKVKRDQESQEEERREQEKRDQEWWEQEKRDRERREQVKRDQERRDHQRQEQGRKLRELEEQKWKEELESIDLAKRELELKEAKLKLKKREKDRKYEEKMKKQQDEKKDQKRRDLERRDLERQDQLKRDQELEKREQERRRDYENHQRELRKEELQSSNPESSFYQPKKRGQGSPRKDPTAAPQWSNADISKVAALEAAYLAVQEQDVQERNKRGRPRKYPVQQVFHPIKIEAISLSSDDDFEN